MLAGTGWVGDTKMISCRLTENLSNNTRSVEDGSEVEQGADGERGPELLKSISL